MYWFTQPCQQYFLVSMVCKYFYTLCFKLFCSIDLWCACHADVLLVQCFCSFGTDWDICLSNKLNSLWTTIQVARCYQLIQVEFVLKIMCLAGWHIWLFIVRIQTISSTQPLAQNPVDEDDLLFPQVFIHGRSSSGLHRWHICAIEKCLGELETWRKPLPKLYSEQ